MKPTKFKDQNATLGKPKTMTDEECSSLDIKRTENGGHPAMESVWELDDAELAMIQKSRRVRIGIVGTMHPPIYMKVEEPEPDAVAFEEVKKESDMLNWDAAIAHLTDAKNQFEAIGPDGSLALNRSILPLLRRFEANERSTELYNEIMEIEL